MCPLPSPSPLLQVLFAEVTDAFQSPFQDGPLDLDFPDCFFANRRAGIRARLSAIATMSNAGLVAALRASYLQHYGQVRLAWRVCAMMCCLSTTA